MPKKTATMAFLPRRFAGFGGDGEEFMIVNLTQHPATPDQLAAGVVDVLGPAREDLLASLTFEKMPTRQQIGAAAYQLTMIATVMGADQAMIGGAPWLMSDLEQALQRAGIKPLYSFSRRIVQEERVGNAIKKITYFQHQGFVGPRLGSQVEETEPASVALARAALGIRR